MQKCLHPFRLLALLALRQAPAPGFVLHPRLLRLVQAGGPIILPLLLLVVGARMRLIFRKVQDLFGEVSTRVQEDFSGIRTIKAYTQEAQETEAPEGSHRETMDR